MESEVASLNEKLGETRIQYDQQSEELANMQRELSQLNKEIKDLETGKEKCLKTSQDASLESGRLSHKLKQWEKDSQDCSKMVAALLKSNLWIAHDKALFVWTVWRRL